MREHSSSKDHTGGRGTSRQKQRRSGSGKRNRRSRSKSRSRSRQHQKLANRSAVPRNNVVATSTVGALSASGCRDRSMCKIVHGRYEVHGTSHGKSTFRKVDKFEGFDVLIYYWEDETPQLCGWWIGPAVGADQVWAYHPSRLGDSPPIDEWSVPHDAAADPHFRIVNCTSHDKLETVQAGDGNGGQVENPPAMSNGDAKEAEQLRRHAEDQKKHEEYQQQLRVGAEKVREEAEKKRNQEELERLQKQEEQRRQMEEIQKRREEEERIAREEEVKRQEAERIRREEEERRRRVEEDLRRIEEEKLRIEEERRKHEEEARRQKEEEERRLREEELNIIRRKKEEDRVMYEAELERKREERRRQEEAQRLYEEQRVREERELQQAVADARQKEAAVKHKWENEATLKVLRALRNLSAATPSTVWSLKLEVEQLLITELPETGAKRSMIEAEARVMLEHARRYIDNVQKGLQESGVAHNPVTLS